MELRQLLTSYDMRHYDVSVTDSAEMLLQYILKQDRETALEDGLHVVAVYDHLNRHHAYIYRLTFLVQANRVNILCLLMNFRLPMKLFSV